jgi:hypothetical protein
LFSRCFMPKHRHLALQTRKWVPDTFFPATFLAKS